MDEKTRELWGIQNRWVNDGDKLKGKCIEEIKDKIVKRARKYDPERDYETCKCGIEVLPRKLINLRAIHGRDCEYGELIYKELTKCGQPTCPPGGWLNSDSLLGKKVKRSKRAYKFG